MIVILYELIDSTITHKLFPSKILKHKYYLNPTLLEFFINALKKIITKPIDRNLIWLGQSYVREATTESEPEKLAAYAELARNKKCSFAFFFI